MTDEEKLEKHGQQIAVLEEKQKKSDDTLQKNFDKIFNWFEKHNGVHSSIDIVLNTMQLQLENINKANEAKEKYKLSLTKGIKIAFISAITISVFSFLMMLYSLSVMNKYYDNSEKILKQKYEFLKKY